MTVTVMWLSDAEEGSRRDQSCESRQWMMRRVNLDGEELSAYGPIRTNPTAIPTASDGEEHVAETDPLDDQEIPEGDGLSGEGVVADTTGDSDGDGLSDAEEGLSWYQPK